MLQKKHALKCSRQQGAEGLLQGHILKCSKTARWWSIAPGQCRWVLQCTTDIAEIKKKAMRWKAQKRPMSWRPPKKLNGEAFPKKAKQGSTHFGYERTSPCLAGDKLQKILSDEENKEPESEQPPKEGQWRTLLGGHNECFQEEPAARWRIQEDPGGMEKDSKKSPVAWRRIPLVWRGEGFPRTTGQRNWRTPPGWHCDGLQEELDGAMKDSVGVAWWRTPGRSGWHDDGLLGRDTMKGSSGATWWYTPPGLCGYAL